MSRRRWWWLATGAGSVAAVVLATRPQTVDGPVLCLFRRVVELPCPGCGLTRALTLLVRGEWSAAVALHPLAPLLAAEFAIGWVLLGLAAHGSPHVPGRRRLETWLAATGFLLLAVWMGRLAVGDLSPLA